MKHFYKHFNISQGLASSLNMVSQFANERTGDWSTWPDPQKTTVLQICIKLSACDGKGSFFFSSHIFGTDGFNFFPC